MVRVLAGRAFSRPNGGIRKRSARASTVLAGGAFQRTFSQPTLRRKAAPKERTVLAGGAFQLIHPGHLRFLRFAARHGRLTVVIAHDRTVLRNKGYLLAPARDRAKLVAALAPVDRVVLGHSSDFFTVVRRLRPDIIVLGPDQRMPGLAAAIKAAGLKTRIVRYPGRYKGLSTRALARAIAAAKPVKTK